MGGGEGGLPSGRSSRRGGAAGRTRSRRLHQAPGLACLERQAEAAEQLLAERQAGEQN